MVLYNLSFLNYLGRGKSTNLRYIIHTVILRVTNVMQKCITKILISIKNN